MEKIQLGSILVIGAIYLGIIIFLAWLILKPEEPRYKDKSKGGSLKKYSIQWLEEELQDLCDDGYICSYLIIPQEISSIHIQMTINNEKVPFEETKVLIRNYLMNNVRPIHIEFDLLFVPLKSPNK